MWGKIKMFKAKSNCIKDGSSIEAIIDQETFEIVQNIRNGRRRLTPMGEMPVLPGMLFCADCGVKLHQIWARGGACARIFRMRYLPQAEGQMHLPPDTQCTSGTDSADRDKPDARLCA